MKTYQSKTSDIVSKVNANQPFFTKNQAPSVPAPFFRPSLVQAKLKEAQDSSSEGLDKETKPDLENFLGHSLSNIKIHNNRASHEASNLIQAKAYTTGNHIFLGNDVNSMSSIQRKSLLAHEAVHTIQQKSFSPATIQAKSIIDSPQSLHEQEANNIASAFVKSQGEGYRSSALQMPSVMQVSAIKSPAIQRVPTWGGDWSTTRYDKKQDIDSQGNVYPAAMGVRGVDIELKFTPNNNANAELIGLTQSVQSVVNNALNLTPAAATRNIKSSDAININTGPGETDEGTAIDRATGYNNPIYPVSSQPSSTLDDTNTVGTWGQHGWNSSSKTPPKQDAILIDWPVRSGASTNSRQIFETTALATKGVQSGTYYGSVRWGWRTDNNGNFDTIPLQSVSQGVPSSTFMKSAEIWNAAKDSTGADTVNLPIVDVKITTARISEVIPPATSSPFSPQPPLMTPLVRERSIPAGTRIQILTYGASLITGGERLPQIKIIDGPFTGETMSILGADLINLRDERP